MRAAPQLHILAPTSATAERILAAMRTTGTPLRTTRLTKDELTAFQPADHDLIILDAAAFRSLRGRSVPLAPAQADGPIAFRSGAATVLLHAAEITHISTSDGRSCLHVLDGQRFTVSPSLRDLVDALAPLGFIRVHQQFAIGLHHLRLWRPAKGGEVTLKDGTRLPVSRRLRSTLLELLAGMEHSAPRTGNPH